MLALVIVWSALAEPVSVPMVKCLLYNRIRSIFPVPSYFVTATASLASAASLMKTVITAPEAGVGLSAILHAPLTKVASTSSASKTPFTATITSSAASSPSAQSVVWSYASQVPEIVNALATAQVIVQSFRNGVPAESVKVACRQILL